MNQYQRFYNLISEMVWTIGGAVVGPRKFNPNVLRGVTRLGHRGARGGGGAPLRRTVKVMGKQAKEIEKINVSPDETEVAPWNKRAKRTLTTHLGKLPGSQGTVRLPGVTAGADISVPVDKPESTKEKKKTTRKKKTPRVLQQGEHPRGSAGKSAGREPGT